MLFFESILIIMLAALVLAAGSRRAGVPYPVALAHGGTALAFLPNASQISLDPELVLALFIAPILLDASFDTSARDLRKNWLPVGSLVFVAVGITTTAVAIVVRWFTPDMSWVVAIALGALLVQGLTLPALLNVLALGDNRPVEREFAVARKVALEAALASIGEKDSVIADAVRDEYRDMLDHTGDKTRDTTHNELRRNAITAAREVALELRRRGTIGDNAFHRLEQELNWLELSPAPREAG